MLVKISYYQWNVKWVKQMKKNWKSTDSRFHWHFLLSRKKTLEKINEKTNRNICVLFAKMRQWRDGGCGNFKVVSQRQNMRKCYFAHFPNSYTFAEVGNFFLPTFLATFFFIFWTIFFKCRQTPTFFFNYLVLINSFAQWFS